MQIIKHWFRKNNFISSVVLPSRGVKNNMLVFANQRFKLILITSFVIQAVTEPATAIIGGIIGISAISGKAATYGFSIILYSIKFMSKHSITLLTAWDVSKLQAIVAKIILFKPLHKF